MHSLEFFLCVGYDSSILLALLKEGKAPILNVNEVVYHLKPIYFYIEHYIYIL
jgi:hypothetical protein